MITFLRLTFPLEVKTPDKEEVSASPSVSVEQTSDVDLDESLQIIPGETPPANDDEVEVESSEGIIQPDVAPPEEPISVIVLKS